MVTGHVGARRGVSFARNGDSSFSSRIRILLMCAGERGQKVEFAGRNSGGFFADVEVSGLGLQFSGKDYVIPNDVIRIT